MSKTLKPITRRLMAILPISIGAVVLFWLQSTAKEPARKTEHETARVLRVIKVPVCDVVPRVEAFGTAEPGQVWRAVSEVKGRVIQVHDELRSGSIVQKGEELLQIDRTEYVLAVKQLKAEIANSNAQLKELDASQANDKASLTIEQDVLTLAEDEQTRLEQLVKDKSITQANLDAQIQKTLGQRQKVQALKNSLNLVASRRDSLEATIAAQQTSLNRAELDVKKTTLVAPYNCRLADVSIEVGQFISVGELLFEAHSTALAEIEAQVSVDQASTLILPRDSELGSDLPSMQTVRQLFKIGALVTNATGNDAAQWNATFLRIRETIDAQTRTVGIVVGVDRPYEKIIPGRRPPLLRGTFCRVLLTGETRSDRVVIPRSAVRNSAVFLVDENNRLTSQKVAIEFLQGSFAVIKSGLSGGETLIVSDPTPAVDGMLIKPRSDSQRLADLLNEVSPISVKDAAND